MYVCMYVCMYIYMYIYIYIYIYAWMDGGREGGREGWTGTEVLVEALASTVVLVAEDRISPVMLFCASTAWFQLFFG